MKFLEIINLYNNESIGFADSILEIDPCFEYETIDFDTYDSSVEFINVANNNRLSESLQKFIHSKGFRKCYLNHWDKWQTHYTWSDNFITHEGFRIKYYINGLKEVEQFPKDWPKEWLDSGYVKVVIPENRND